MSHLSANIIYDINVSYKGETCCPALNLSEDPNTIRCETTLHIRPSGNTSALKQGGKCLSKNNPGFY